MVESNRISCNHLQEFVDIQIDVIKRHLDKHKWYNGIADETIGTMDFIKKYGWLMRDVYCYHVCTRATECAISEELESKKCLLQNQLPN